MYIQHTSCVRSRKERKATQTNKTHNPRPDKQDTQYTDQKTRYRFRQPHKTNTHTYMYMYMYIPYKYTCRTCSTEK